MIHGDGSLKVRKKIARIEIKLKKLRAERDALQPVTRIRCLGWTVGDYANCTSTAVSQKYTCKLGTRISFPRVFAYVSSNLLARF